jgi:hypothetical protein
VRVDLSTSETIDQVVVHHADGLHVRVDHGRPSRPAESRLRRFEHQELEMSAIVVVWHTSFPIVILEQQLIVDVHP